MVGNTISVGLNDTAPAGHSEDSDFRLQFVRTSPEQAPKSWGAPSAPQSPLGKKNTTLLPLVDAQLLLAHQTALHPALRDGQGQDDPPSAEESETAPKSETPKGQGPADDQSTIGTQKAKRSVEFGFDGFVAAKLTEDAYSPSQAKPQVDKAQPGVGLLGSMTGSVTVPLESARLKFDGVVDIDSFPNAPTNKSGARVKGVASATRTVETPLGKVDLTANFEAGRLFDLSKGPKYDFQLVGFSALKKLHVAGSDVSLSGKYEKRFTDDNLNTRDVISAKIQEVKSLGRSWKAIGNLEVSQARYFDGKNHGRTDNTLTIEGGARRGSVAFTGGYEARSSSQEKRGISALFVKVTKYF
jgi:hypothetical protein